MEKKNLLEKVDLNQFTKVLPTLPCPEGYKWELSISIDESYEPYPIRVYIDLRKTKTTV